ncbi:hypothetical protein BKA62DRAFT_776942 [Auriculariales sp. MPI-PUGE-AT-0066]|nr:hypothetical protein BKA62DRAFT_776942 [Auriculariales sp. MPI-PUGE-AT-0066]
MEKPLTQSTDISMLLMSSRVTLPPYKGRSFVLSGTTFDLFSGSNGGIVFDDSSEHAEVVVPQHRMREEAALNDAKDNEPQPKRVTAQHILSHLFSETGIPLHALLRTVQLRRQVAAGIQPERLHEATGHTTYFCLEGEYFQGNLTSPPLEQLPAGQDWGGKGLHTAELRAFIQAHLQWEFVTEIGKASVIIVEMEPPTHAVKHLLVLVRPFWL